MDAAEQWEPDEARASRPVLRARGGEIPLRDSPDLSLQERRGGAGWSAIADRFAACKLVLHPHKTKIVYCKDVNRRDDFPDIAAQPPITIPTISLVGGGSGLGGATRRGADRPPQFTGPYQQRVIPVVGHNIPQEAPKEVAEAVLDLLGLRTNGRRAG